MKSIYPNIKKRIKLRNTFQKLIFSYIVIITLILLLSSSILYYGYRQQIIEQSNIISKKLLNQADYYSEYTHQWAISYLYQLYLDQDIYNLLFNRNPSEADVSAGMAKLKNSVTLQKTIQSVYVFNSINNTIYPSDGSPSAADAFYDKDIKSLLSDNTETISSRFLPRRIKIKINGQEYEKDVLTLVISNVKATGTSMPYGAIILNLDVNDVQYYYKNITEKEYNIMAIDENGRVIFNSNPELFLENISGRNYIDKILASHDKTGSFTSEWNGSPSIISYYTNNRMGIRFILSIPFETLTGSINKMVRLLIGTALLLFLISVTIAFISFKKIYAPIDKTIKTVREYLKAGTSTDSRMGGIDAGANDTDYLAQLVDTIISRPMLKNQMTGLDLQFVKKQLLKGLLFNASFEIRSFKNKLTELDVNIDFENILVTVFKIDAYKKMEREFPKDELETLKLSMFSEIQSIMGEVFKNEVVSMDDDTFCVIISLGHEYGPGAAEYLVKRLESLQSYLYNQFYTSVSVSIGDFVEDIVDISASYRSAMDYINYRFKFGPRSVIYPEKIKSGINCEVKFDQNFEEGIFKELKSGNIAKVEAELEKVFEVISQLAYQDMLLAVTDIFSNSQKVINGIVQISKSGSEINVEKFTPSSYKFQTLEEVKVYLLSVYLNTINQVKEKMKNKKNETVDRVISYIDENYWDALLTPESIAENFDLSHNYLRVLFKEVEGKSLSTYISEVRFSNAKALLESTNMTVAEISAKVGFTNDNYFYTAFKKFYGVSPNYYRNSMKASN